MGNIGYLILAGVVDSGYFSGVAEIRDGPKTVWLGLWGLATGEVIWQRKNYIKA